MEGGKQVSDQVLKHLGQRKLEVEINVHLSHKFYAVESEDWRGLHKTLTN